jgi:hypothetical protein
MRDRPDIGKFRDLMDLAEARRNKGSHHITQTAVSQLRRYYRFLQVIVGRSEAESAVYSENSRRYMQLAEANASKGRKEFTAEEVEVFENLEALTDELHLDIASFYLFAKIFLDKIARFIEYYFGAQVRSRPLDSHDDLVKNLESYSEAKGLKLPKGLMDAARNLKTKIADLRDYYISHEKSPRTMHGSLLDSNGRVRLVLHRMNPTESEKQGLTTQVLGELLIEIDDYISLIVEMIKQNQPNKEGDKPDSVPPLNSNESFLVS